MTSVAEGAGQEVQPLPDDYVVDPKRDRLVIVASSLGTVFEWYDFFIYGTLAPVIATLFFPAGNPTAAFLLTLADLRRRLRRATAGRDPVRHSRRQARPQIHLPRHHHPDGRRHRGGRRCCRPTPRSESSRRSCWWSCRLLQGLALGGEYGGAAIYVAEHAPHNKRGLYTSFIQASVIGGFLLSVGTVLATNALVTAEARDAWAWRIPFLVSLLLLAVSLWVRLKLKESPVFQAMKEAGATARNPFRESFRGRYQVKMILVALFGVAAGLTVIWYTAQFQALYFLQNALRIDDTAARLMVGVAAFFSLFWFVLFGWLSDKIGRKTPIVIGYGLTIILLFPLFHWMAGAANPELAIAMERNPVVVQGGNCDYNPFARGAQETPCARALDALTRRGIAYTLVPAPGWQGDAYQARIGSKLVNAEDPAALEPALAQAGYRFEKTRPPLLAGDPGRCSRSSSSASCPA